MLFSFITKTWSNSRHTGALRSPQHVLVAGEEYACTLLYDAVLKISIFASPSHSEMHTWRQDVKPQLVAPAGATRRFSSHAPLVSSGRQYLLIKD